MYLLFICDIKALLKGCISAYKNVSVSPTPVDQVIGCINAIKIDEDDQLIGVVLTDGDNDVMLSMRNGKAIRFHESGARSMGRVSRGVRGVRLEGDDRVVSIDIVDTSRQA